MPTGKERMFRVEATKYYIVSRVLFHRNKVGKLLRRVICHENDKKAIRTALNNEAGHVGKNATVKKILQQYWWKNGWPQTRDYIKACDKCQRRINVRVEQVLHPNITSTMWKRVAVDIVYMPKGTRGNKYLVLAREDVLGWPEARDI